MSYFKFLERLKYLKYKDYKYKDERISFELWRSFENNLVYTDYNFFKIRKQYISTGSYSFFNAKDQIVTKYTNFYKHIYYICG